MTGAMIMITVMTTITGIMISSLLGSIIAPVVENGRAYYLFFVLVLSLVPSCIGLYYSAIYEYEAYIRSPPFQQQLFWLRFILAEEALEELFNQSDDDDSDSYDDDDDEDDSDDYEESIFSASSTVNSGSIYWLDSNDSGYESDSSTAST